MTTTPRKSLPRVRRWRIPLLILALLGLGVLAAGAALWWFNRPIQATVLTPPEKAVLEEKMTALEEAPPTSPGYTPGDKEIILSERELNGLIHENTQLGDQLKLELAKDAVHARLSLDIPEDFPLMAGKKLKGRARFLVKDASEAPALILEDLTLWGISLPNAWLGDLKGQNLLANLLSSDGSSLAGVEEISIDAGQLVIRLAE
ncbi:hypothetical protein [Roseibacillus ishigakijimensis]|uniref:Arginine N-succinyltransferase n=1 Tax=Roseibacillus ishigakijimensis TaxID=454146 RepID=A0A934VMZ0_9BACT|nr:hypothetical protein [Roseibacillus ishigakijimensis]MBK1834586.1 hypothetical protein [Roseibacillus ishigakijimensis]